MSKRFTETNKWDDKWFRGLTPGCKLMFLFITDKCDLAGFYEIDTQDIAFRTGLEESKILGAIQGLDRGLLVKGDWVWMRNFLHHQKNLPLNPLNNAHKHIIQCVSDKLSLFPEVPKLIGAKKGLFSPIGNGKGNGKGKSKGKKAGKVTEYTPEFEAFYANYPRREDKRKAFESYTAVISRGVDSSTIHDGASRYTKFCKADGREAGKIKLPSTWLNNDCWENEYKSTPMKKESKCFHKMR